jgi:uncharacterized protein
MKLTMQSQSGVHVIRSLTDEGVRIGERLFAGSVIVTASAIVEDWPPRDLDELTAAHLQQALDLEPEILLLGTGQRQRFPSRALLASLYEAHIGHEAMDTRAACRTYNVLVGEGRSVAAALIIER